MSNPIGIISNNESRFDSAVFEKANPAVLCQLDWQRDNIFVSALCESWQAQYAEYIGENDAKALVSRLMVNGEILAHEPADTLVATVNGVKAGITSLRQLPGLSLITQLEVLNAYRQCGIGKQLIMALMTINEPLLAHVSIHRPGVKAFYASLGFRVLQQSQVDHYGYSLWFDVMVREADAHLLSE